MKPCRMTQVAAVLVLPLTAGCSNAFRQIYPGMSGAQVAEVMKSGPTRTEQFDGGYSAWYYGEDRCVLLEGDRVVSKQQSQKGDSVNTPFVTVNEKIRAQCLPPGVERVPEREVRIDTPLGGVHVEEKKK
jgi:hypothetical protein